MALDNAAGFVAEARYLLQDGDGARYNDKAIYDAMTDGLSEIRRMRPDIFFGVTVNTPGPNVDMSGLPDVARVALLYFVCAYAETSDQEASDVGRATMFGNRFIAQMATASTAT